MLEAAERYSLYEIDPSLRSMALSAGQTPGSLTDKIRMMFIGRVQQLLKLRETTGFLPAPPEKISNGIFTLGTVNGVLFRLTEYELLKHIIYFGPTGSGKTSASQPLALQCLALGVHAIIPDYKNDLSWLAARHQDFLIFHPDVPLNILDHPSYVERSDYITMLISIITRSFYGGEHLRQVTHETLWEVYRRQEQPSIMDWYNTVKARQNPRDTYQRRDAINGLLMRLTRLIEQLPGMARTNNGIKHEQLWEHSIYIGALQQNDTTEFLTAWIVNAYFQFARRSQLRNNLRYLLFFDESLLSFSDSNNRIDGPVLLPLIPLLREYGAAIVASTAHLVHHHPHATCECNRRQHRCSYPRPGPRTNKTPTRPTTRTSHRSLRQMATTIPNRIPTTTIRKKRDRQRMAGSHRTDQQARTNTTNTHHYSDASSNCNERASSCAARQPNRA
jgi:hypothetical protein